MRKTPALHFLLVLLLQLLVHHLPLLLILLQYRLLFLAHTQALHNPPQDQFHLLQRCLSLHQKENLKHSMMEIITTQIGIIMLMKLAKELLSHQDHQDHVIQQECLSPQMPYLIGISLIKIQMASTQSQVHLKHPKENFQLIIFKAMGSKMMPTFVHLFLCFCVSTG